MTKKLLFVVSILCALAFTALAAGIDGKWTAEQPGRNGGPARVTTFTLKADGAKLTGSVSAPGRGGDVTSTDISEGTVNGNNVTFKVTRDMGGNSFTTSYTGTLDGDTLNLKVTAPGRNGGEPTTRDMVAKRATT